MRPVCACDEQAAGLVEADVSVPPESQDHEVDASGASDRPLEPRTFRGSVSHGAVQQMRPLRRKIHVVEEMPLHERVVAPPIVGRQAQEFVEVERRGAREIDVI